MTTNDVPLLSVLIALPLAGSVLVLAMDERRARAVALATALATFLATLAPLFLFREGEPGFQFVEYRPWVGSLGIAWHLGIDGLSLFLLPLTGFLSLAAVLVKEMGRKAKGPALGAFGEAQW